MRRAIIAISCMLIGASILTFISALLIPMLKELPPRAKKDETEIQLSSNSQKQIIEKNPIHTTLASPATSELEPSITPSQAENQQSTSKDITSSDQPQPTSDVKPTPAPEEIALDENIEKPSVEQSTPATPETTQPDVDEQATEPAPPVIAAAKPAPDIESVTLLVLGEGLFPRGKVNPKENIQNAIDKIIPLIKARPGDNVIVEGHADRKQSDEGARSQSSKWNKIISFQRAREIAMVLEKKGIPSDRIIVKGLGDSVPIASNLTDEGREKNRRVEIKLSGTKQ